MIGVCIKYFHENYGGMLQAFATIKMLESREMEYELIRYKKNLTLRKKIKSIPRLLNTVLLKDKYEAFLKKKGMMKHPEFAENNAIRMKAFDEFKKNKFIKLSTEYVGYKELCKGAKKYSAVISGSDQLWSPAGLPTNFYNLMFVPDEVRKISYASSFGVSQIPWYQTKRTANYLKRLDYISMRENRGSQIVKELIGKEVPVILDPVFNFDKEQWKELIPVKNEISEEEYTQYIKKQIADCVKWQEEIGLDVLVHGEYERNDTQVKEIVNVFKNIDINFKEVHLIDNRVFKEDAYKYIEKTDIVYLMGGSPELEMKSIIEYNLFNILRNRNGITIGTSAGAMNQTDRVIYKDDFKNYELVDYQGLGFIDLNIYPHFDIDNKEYMDEVLEVSKYTRIIGLPNESFIRIKDNDIDFVGKHYFIENGVME